MGEQRLTKDEQIVAALGKLARRKNRVVAADVLDEYADELAALPLEASLAAIHRISLDSSEFFPPLGRIIAEMGEFLRGDAADTGLAPVLSPEGAWRLARTTISRYQPQARPRPESGNPAVDAALRDLGGVAACRWEDAIGEGIVRRAFLERYERAASSARHIDWALLHGPRETPVVAGLEIPDHEIARMADEAAELGRALPEPLARARDGEPERAIALDGRPREMALPPPPPREMSPSRRAAIREEVRAGIARLVGRLRMPGAVPPPAEHTETGR